MAVLFLDASYIIALEMASDQNYAAALKHSAKSVEQGFDFRQAFRASWIN